MQTMLQSTLPADALRVRDYYEQSWSAFRKFWSNPQNLALHFGYWDEQTRNHAESLINMNRQLALRAQVRRSERILDAGCGVGGSALWLAANYQARVVGINLVAAHLERAREFTRERRLERQVSFAQQDFLCTSFADQSFDLVWAQESSCHARDKRAFLAEAYRVLKPGGRLIVVDGYRFRRDYSSKEEAVLQAWLSNWAIDDLPTGDEMVAWARLAGFSPVTLEDIEPHVRTSHRRLYLVSMVAFPYYWLRYKMGRLSSTKLGLILGALNQWRTIRQNLVFEGILLAEKPSC